MSGVGELLSKASEREERLRKTEEFLAKHLHDRLFVDYFNVFLNLPVFGQRMLLKLHDGHFIFDPPVFTEVNHDRIVAWIAARRFHLFTKTHLFLEYQLCHKLQNLDFELRFYDSARSRRTHHVLQVFANNLLGSVAGMYLFREHLRNSSGSKVFGCWLHVQRFRQTRNLTKRREIFHEIQQCYLHATAFHKLSNRLCKVVAVELLSFPVVPHSETELSARLTTDHYVPSCEVDLSSPKALGLVHRVLLEALRAYWAPCYVMHVLSTQPFTILKELFRVPGGDIILSSSELKILIGRCALFSIQDGQDLIPKHGGAQFESDEWIFSLISSSSSTLSSASSSLTRGKTGGSSFDSVHCVESSDQKLLSRLCSSFLSSERQTTLTPVEECGQPKSADLLNLPSDKGETSSAVSLLRDDKVQVEVSRHHDDTSDEELAEVCAIGELLDTGDDSNQPVYDDEDDDKSKDSKPVPLPSAARRLEPASSSLPRESLEGTTATREDTRGTSGKSKVSDELEDDDRRLRLNLTILALKEMSFKPEPMLYLNQLLRHYLFGYRHLDQEKPVTDRRTLCLLACDDLAGSPFRSYLRGQDPRLHLSYFDFWSAMRRYQQLHDLYRMGNTMNTKYGPPIASLRTQHILYMVNRFFMGSGLDAKILQYRIRINILEDMKAARWSPLINSTLDVVSNVLGIPMMQFILNDRQDFRKHAIDSGTFEVKPKQGPKDKVVIESGLPKVFNSLLKRGTEAASQGAFANRRCLSDPWREDPKHDPDGDMECLRPTDSRGTKYNGVVGVLGEQHRLLAFQFLIVLREDLPDAQVCDVASLARIVRSDYGSLHIHCPSPVKTNYLTILRPERRTFSTTWLKQSSLPQNVPLRTTFSRLSTTVNVRQLLQIRQNRESSSFVLPPKPRTFSDILADETQFQAFKKYLRGKDQAQILSFCEDVQDARRVENSSDRDMIVQKIVEYHFKAGD
ncbi:uncharacterized protein LOC112576827 isoform X4 [Pomacea canaliculata]|nr:uncharacterized protein LOC112576827 isoform X4 [Pomacea canaliculata]